MRLFKILGALCLIGSVAFAICVLFAGTELTLDNQSGTQIYDAEVTYGHAGLRFDDLPDAALRQQSLGKIGDEADFDVAWREASGQHHRAHFSVHSDSFFGYVDIRIRFLPRGEVVLFEGDHPYRPTS